MKRVVFLTVIATLSVALFSCKTTLNTEKPAESYKQFTYTPKPSVISLPVEMKIASLEALVNKQLTGLIYQDTSLTDNGGDNLMVKAWKKENIRLNFDKGQFVYRVPLKLWIKAGWKIDKFGLSLSDYRDVNAEIALKFRTSATVNKDWTLSTVTTSDGYEWLSKPVLKIGPVDLPITFIADLLIDANKKTLTKAIDEGLTQSLDFKTNALDALTEMQKPMLLSDEYKLWLRVKPTGISASAITGTRDVVRFTPVVEAVTECFTGPMPPYNPLKKLPDIKTATQPNDDFVVNVSSYVGYNYIDSITKKELVNTSYKFGNRKILINNVVVYGNDEKLIIATDVSGSLNGKLYFAGIPAYRSSDSSIILNDLKFHLQTQNVLLKTASWLANSGIEKLISKNMSYPVGSDLKETYSEIQQSLKRYELGEGFYATGSLTSLEVQQPVLAPEGIIAPVLLKGKASVKLE